MNKMLYVQVVVFWMFTKVFRKFTTLCFSDDISDFQELLMSSIGS